MGTYLKAFFFHGENKNVPTWPRMVASFFVSHMNNSKWSEASGKSVALVS